jgi:hypothetical protein
LRGGRVEEELKMPEERKESMNSSLNSCVRGGMRSYISAETKSNSSRRCKEEEEEEEADDR